MTQKPSRISERIQEFRLAVLRQVWAIFAVLFGSHNDMIDDDPYWAADGKSEEIRALKY